MPDVNVTKVVEVPAAKPFVLPVTIDRQPVSDIAEGPEGLPLRFEITTQKVQR